MLLILCIIYNYLIVYLYVHSIKFKFKTQVHLLMPYTNSCKRSSNNSVKSSVNSNGEINWSTEIFQNDDMMEDIGFTLTANNIVCIVDSNGIREL